MYRQEKIKEKVVYNTEGVPSFIEVGDEESLDGIDFLCLSRRHYFLGIHLRTSRDYLLDISEIGEVEYDGMG